MEIGILVDSFKLLAKFIFLTMHQSILPSFNIEISERHIGRSIPGPVASHVYGPAIHVKLLALDYRPIITTRLGIYSAMAVIIH